MQYTPFNDPAIRDWIGECVGLPDGFPELLATLGSGPFDEGDFDRFLERLGVDVTAPDHTTDVVVLGRGEWTEQDLTELVQDHVGGSLAVYSQEMLLMWIVAGEDPFDCGDVFLRRLAGDHPALDFLTHFGFEWPTTDVFGGGGTTLEGEWPQRGLLSHMGYHVGRSAGRPETERRTILRRIFESESLPHVNGAHYMREWGTARSRTRLRKLANTLASFSRQEKRKKKPPWEAIEEREADLDWMKRTFYDGRFDFEWPSTYVR